MNKSVKLRILPVVALAGLVHLPQAAGGEGVVVERAASGFRYERIPAPAVTDAGAGAEVVLVAGERDRNGGALARVNDGRLPGNHDDPAGNFFFAAGTDGGRLRMDFKEATEVEAIAVYSWHRSTRAPQVYTVWGAAGDAADFQPAPVREVDPATAGWTLVATVDTRREGEGAPGQHASLVEGGESGGLGSFQHLLFDFRRTEDRDPFGNTFISEIDVTAVGAPKPRRLSSPERLEKDFVAEGGSLRFTVDATLAPRLMPWVEEVLVPEMFEWYPKLRTLLASDGFTAADHVYLEFKNNMGGVPAYASGNRLSLNESFFRSQLEGEAKGCVIHELVHVVQGYHLARRRNANPSPTPGWVTEGVADYVRWFLYEPEKKGARITRHNLKSARYDGSYRISANFIDWVVREHDEDLLGKLNAAAREGRYRPGLWKTWTGSTLEELGEEWLNHHRELLRED